MPLRIKFCCGDLHPCGIFWRKHGKPSSPVKPWRTQGGCSPPDIFSMLILGTLRPADTGVCSVVAVLVPGYESDKLGEGIAFMGAAEPSV